MNPIRIGSRLVGPSHPAFIIAELSANHRQRFDLAIETLQAAKQAGADAIKLQTYTADTITLNSRKPYFQITQGTIWDGRSLHELYQEAYTPWDWQPRLKAEAERLGLECFSSPFDPTAVDFLEKLGMPAYKVASFEITDIPLIRYMARLQKPMIISTGIAEEEDIRQALDACRAEGNNELVVLKCTSAYPAPFTEMNLRTIADIPARFGVFAGLSDHSPGHAAAVAAVALGACVIEKHFILARGLGGPDAEFSLEPAEFKAMVQAVRQAEEALGTVDYALTPKARKSRELGRSLFVVADLKKGELFTRENVRSIRPAYGLHPRLLERVLGQRAAVDVERGEPLRAEMIEGFTE
jgi:pseudaminic acid synthase